MRAGKTFIKNFLNMVEQVQESTVIVVMNNTTFLALKPHFNMVECMYHYEHSMYRLLLHNSVIYVMVMEENMKDFEVKVVDMSKRFEPKIFPIDTPVNEPALFAHIPTPTYGVSKLKFKGEM